MQLCDILNIEGIEPHLKARSKKQALQELAGIAAKITGIEARDIFETLLQRERLGSTGVGNGIAIPHGKLEKLDQLYGVFARLEKPIDFESIDDQNVDLIFLLLAPESAGSDHLKALARVSRTLRSHEVLSKLRHSDSTAALYAILTEQKEPHAA